MVNVTRQGQDEASRLARSRARMPRIKLEYQLPVTKAAVVPAPKVTKKRRARKGVKQQAYPQKCMWYKLPLELRYKVYEEACFQGTHVTVDSAASRQWDAPFAVSHPEGARAFASLLRTCRSIYADLRSHPLLYKHKHFEFDEPQVLHAFLRALPAWALEHLTHVDLEPRRVIIRCPGRRPGRPYSTTTSSSAFQVLVGADDVPATSPDPGLVLAALPEVLPRLQQLRILFSWHTDRTLGVVPVAKHVIRELIAISDLRDRVPGKHHHHNNPSMVPKRDDFAFGFVVAVKFETWMDRSDPHRKKEAYHKWCVHCFINEFRSKDGPVKKYGGKLRNMLKGVEWCVSTDNHRAFRREKLE
ncbi:hypothetical protein PG993_002440 [Apiospora rasikravindrae]|uniref:DUF7730 domain-containing protein n=1 Tax=Apiospora rasikravindrae TaxID=990691 RepID=A0ABR1TWM9_9PEZI